MQSRDTEMASASRSEPSLSAPQSPPVSAPSSPSFSSGPTTRNLTSPMPSAPPAPPPLPLALLPAPPPRTDLEEESDEHLLPSFVGNFDAYLRSAERQCKWALVLILPRRVSISSPSSPDIRPSPRPAWGPGSYHQPQKLYTTRQIADNFMLWRRTAGTQESERYSNFFPVDGSPHMALLDPRSGERLAVWGNVDGEHMIPPNAISDILWQLVVADLVEFLENHSLADDALGPAHYREKSWAVRTRRVTPSPCQPPLQSTAIMDDEEAAIAAAVAASLAESRNPEIEIEDHTSSSDKDYLGEEDEEDDMSSSDSLTQDDVSKESEHSSESQEAEDDDMSMDISPAPSHIATTPSQPVAIPSRGRDPTPSSVESLSLSYIERMESRFRSSTDPALLENRRLRQEQDEDLARSIEADRRRVQAEEAEAAKRASTKAEQLAADARLPSEPAENAAAVLTIAIRLPGGVRITRRFNSFDFLRSVADFAISKTGFVHITQRAPGAVLRIPGAPLKATTWDVKLSELALSNRTMFVLNSE